MARKAFVHIFIIQLYAQTLLTSWNFDHDVNNMQDCQVYQCIQCNHICLLSFFVYRCKGKGFFVTRK